MPNQYEAAGVNIQAGEKAVDQIKQVVKETQDQNVLSGLGGFGAEYDLTTVISNYRQPVLISGADGVGTKLMLAVESNQHDTIGIDLVAMCANDILAQGARPLYFLDYIGLGKLQPDRVATIVAGIANGCRQAGLSLIGGEMAEMPGIYRGEDYDLSGFAVGIAEKERLFGTESVQEGDVLVGLSSSGLHSNGFSLVRHIIKQRHLDLEDQVSGSRLIDELLTPTKLYYSDMRPLIDDQLIHAAANITGGGLAGNLARMIPTTLTAKIDTESWHTPSIFNYLQRVGGVSTTDMRQVFNMGIGMVLVVGQSELPQVEATLQQQQTTYNIIGKVVMRHERSVEYC